MERLKIKLNSLEMRFLRSETRKNKIKNNVFRKQFDKLLVEEMVAQG